MNVLTKFKGHISFTRSWTFGFGSGVANLRTSNLGEEEAVGGRGWYGSKEPC